MGPALRRRAFVRAGSAPSSGAGREASCLEVQRRKSLGASRIKQRMDFAFNPCKYHHLFWRKKPPPVLLRAKLKGQTSSPPSATSITDSCQLQMNALAVPPSFQPKKLLDALQLSSMALHEAAEEQSSAMRGEMFFPPHTTGFGLIPSVWEDVVTDLLPNPL
ncbi:uncharacterized protein LOC121110067 isoform X1 [Gallus gallus]|uniref:uncharacterized protein LOC121110067 isoform X1 n=1 Tax=Gallus gallus TaxID=9031 RepID=UPI001F01C218|nr:uncharacterized protein LOC121110067 isoform X1 [Gallus gallus]